MKILIDTNVLISAFVFKGKPRELIRRLLAEGNGLLVTSYIDDEFHRILERKWPLKAEKIYEQFLGTGFSLLESAHEQYGALRDPKDVPVLSDAVHYGADVILSGDKDFLEAGLKRPAVKSVAELWDLLGYDDP